MNSTIKNISDTKVLMTITVSAEELAIAEQVALTKLARDVKVAGFRKGKVPLAVASKNIDPMVLQEESLNNAISKAVADAFLHDEVRALDRPEVEIKKYVPGETLEITAEVEVMPKVELGNYKKLKAEVKKTSVSDDEVNEVIERMRRGLSDRQSVDRPAKDGDETIIDFVGKKDGVAFEGGSAADYRLELGSNQFIPGFEAGIVGHKIGEAFDIDLTFPDDYMSSDLKGAKVVFTVTLKDIKEVALPEVTDEFAAKAGPFTTVKELKDDVKCELTTQKDNEEIEKLKEDLVNQLVAASKVPTPEVLVADQAKSIEQDFESNLMYQGLTVDQYLQNKGFGSIEKWRETEVRDAAVKRVQAALVLGELSKVEKIEANEAELEANLERYRRQYAKNPDALKRFEQPEVRRDVANRLLTEKTVDRLVELNKK